MRCGEGGMDERREMWDVDEGLSKEISFHSNIHVVTNFESIKI